MFKFNTFSLYHAAGLRKDCPLCGKQGLLKLSNHLADYHHLSTKDRQYYLRQAKILPLDRILNELMKIHQSDRI